MPNSRPTMANNTSHHEDPDITDDRPLAVRRKRRISTGLADPVNTSGVQQTEGPRQAPKTPTKPKKRVRFSDPGPETSTASSSTGLTPYLSRASFEPRARETSPSRPSPPRPRPLAKTPKRLSLPTQLSISLPSPSLSPPPVPISGEVQFAPLHQILDPRLKRRLRRNHLSEEINDIDAKKRSEAQLRQEIKNLREQLALAKESAKEHSDGMEGNAPSSERIQQLEQELDELKRERSTTAEPRSSGPETQESLRPDIEVFVDDGSGAPASSGAGTQEPLTPEIEIYVDDDSDGVLIAPDSDSDGILQDVELVQASASVNEAATQASLPSPHAETLRAARLSLEYLFPGEIALGLIPEDPKRLFDVILERMQTLKAQTFIAEDALSRTQTQESNLRNQFNAVLEQLDRARKYAEGISTRTSNDRARADSSQARVVMLETSVEAATMKVNELEKDAGEKDRSIQKLQDALDTYRVEVGKLELLIARMEGDHNTAISNLRAEMDEAVADLECHVAAETTGRREAEQEVDEKNERIKQLKVQEQELKNALNEKQQIIRETEKIFEEERVGREREVGGLNVRIGQLSSDLSESNTKVANAEQKQQILMRKLQEEREAGLRSVKAVQAELASAVNKSEDIKTAHVSDVQRRGAEVTQHQGLLTPVSACRFKDVEGYVEVRRGKGQGRNRDSGVVIREEDEDEDMVMADDM
ncbi:hypothetical protein OEA41_000267 [Lepraria neglecta]|uniref:Uncharacterized protein n=1 Tax=Lepraria neglecta TaxID=209136 RepID=A0AAE0DPA7_9LECA|nr:hypothetical protein OEA41_000267 [Lepraria neglecta]